MAKPAREEFAGYRFWRVVHIEPNHDFDPRSGERKV